MSNHEWVSLQDGRSVFYGYTGNRLTSVTDVRGGTDDTGNVTQRTYPGVLPAGYSYDDDGRLTSVASEGSTTAYAYDANANVVQTQLPAANGHVETRQYDRADRLTRISNEKSSTILSRFDYAYDAGDNPTSVTTPSGVTTYGYDVRDRLIDVCFQASCPGGSDPFIRYAYDSVGNRTSEARPVGTSTYTYNAADQLTAADGPAGTTAYTYDANGNETQAGARTFAYDLAHRMTSTTQGGTTTSYGYDGDGNRLTASWGSLDSQKTKYVWDVNMGLPQLALERDGAGAAQRTYLYGNQRIAMQASGARHYFHYDGLGSVMNLTSPSGGKEWSYTYEPFGAEQIATKDDPAAPDNVLRFTGELLDPTGLYDLRARQYDPRTGRFTALDPRIQPRNVPFRSSYAYADDNPLVLVDPSGKGAVYGNTCGSFACWGRDPNNWWDALRAGGAAAACAEGAEVGLIGGPLGALAGCLAVATAFDMGAEQMKGRVEEEIEP